MKYCISRISALILYIFLFILLASPWFILYELIKHHYQLLEIVGGFGASFIGVTFLCFPLMLLIDYCLSIKKEYIRSIKK